MATKVVRQSLLSSPKKEGQIHFQSRLKLTGAIPKMFTHRIVQCKPSCACDGNCPRCANGILPKTSLEISTPDDTFEREADRIAHEVLQSDGPSSTTDNNHASTIERKCGPCSTGGDMCPECTAEVREAELPARMEDKTQLQTKINSTSKNNESQNQDHYQKVPPIVSEVLQSPGQPLDSATRAFFEPRFGRDFSAIRVHLDVAGAESAAALDARACVIGNHLMFGVGEYAPGSTDGRRLLAHELTHVVQQAENAKTDSQGLLLTGHPAEQEARQVSEHVAVGLTASHISQTISSNQIGRDEKNTGSPKPSAVGSAPSPSRVRLDILGADLSVKDALARAAARAVGADIRVTSLEDMISKLRTQAGQGTGRCVERLTIWNHGKPGLQVVAGEEPIRTKDNRIIRLPRTGFDLDWLLASGNQNALARFREVFCCNASMHWLGCSTAGVEASGGVRTQHERVKPEHRYELYSERYQNVQEALAHGASLLGASFGLSNIRGWSDATCTTITAANDFTFITPDNPRELYHVGFGGQEISIAPSAESHCACDPATGRPQGGWSPAAEKRLISAQEETLIGSDFLWHLYLQTFHELWQLSNRSQVRDQIASTFMMLVNYAAAGASFPSGLPKERIIPWINIDTPNPDWSAVTTPYLALCFPDNCWRWITLNQTAVESTPAYTLEILNHEILHAADVWSSVKEFKRSHGDPPAGAGDRCRPVNKDARLSWTDPWGSYVNEFVQFYETRTTPARHVEIYGIAAAPLFSRFTAKEKLTWFGGMLNNVPPRLAAHQGFDAEQMIESIFRNPQPSELALREQIADLLSRTTSIFVLGDARGQGIDLGKGRTLLNHFDLVWRLRPQEHALLLRSLVAP